MSKTKITDLMSYHLSQLYQEVSVNTTIDPELSFAVEKCISDNDSFNALDNTPPDISNFITQIHSQISSFYSQLETFINSSLETIALDQIHAIEFLSFEQLPKLNKHLNISLQQNIQQSNSQISTQITVLNSQLTSAIKELATQTLSTKLELLTEQIKSLKNKDSAPIGNLSAKPTSAAQPEIPQKITPAKTIDEPRSVPSATNSRPLPMKPIEIAKLPKSLDDQSDAHNPSSPEKKKGFASKLLNHLTKARPKAPNRKNKKDSDEVILQESQESIQEPQMSEADLENNDHPIIPIEQEKTPQVNSETTHTEPTHTEHTQAMSALASAMMAGSRKTSHDENSPKNQNDSLNTSSKRHSRPLPIPSHVAESPERKVSSPDEKFAQNKTMNNDTSFVAKDNPINSSLSESLPPKKMPTNEDAEIQKEPVKDIVSSKPLPPKRPVKNMVVDTHTDPNENDNKPLEKPVPRPQKDYSSPIRPQSEFFAQVGSSPLSANPKRPSSVALDNLEAAHDANAINPPIVPRRIPGVFNTNHGALGALAAAVNGRKTPSNSPLDSAAPELPNEIQNLDLEHQTMATEEKPHYVPVKPPVMHAPIVASNPLVFKKKDTSTSGDDKAIEKSALEWLNEHLSLKEIKVDDLYTSLGDGLNLIFALEHSTGESVGKYNKRTMLPVHRIDNISVALNFLAKKGIDVQFLSPQDIMDGNKGKILTLFNYIIKVCQ